MHQLSANDKIELEQVIKSAGIYLDLHNQGQRFAAETQRQHDSIAVWVVGICAGAVLALGPMHDLFVDRTIITGWQLWLLHTFFVLGVLLGIVHRCYLAQMMEADKICAFKKSTLAATVVLKEVHTAQDIKQIKLNLQNVIEGSDNQLQELCAKAKAWQGRVNRIQFIPLLMLFFGVLTFALIALRQI